ncbi:RNA polymerase sigma factor [Paenibacillus borealis]|uniref:RNA polymerase sigma factor n=1 Tax=Paenibacillus borealis TaxID=160799 RepID=UPI000694ED32|nr:RNA polymerase sigma factor [Paenibacillus borealis]
MRILEHHRIPDTMMDIDKKNLQALGTALHRYCLSLTRSSFDAEDLAQETWTKALGYSKFNVSPNPEALLLRIAKNTWIDAARRRGSLIRALERSETLADSALVPAPQGDRSEIEPAFQALIKHLSPLQRAAFVLRDVMGYSASETAAHISTTEGAVKAALHRARLALSRVREELAENEGPALPPNADYRAYLQALAHAYEQGQIPVMLELLRQETAAEVTVAVSTATVHAQYSGSGSFSYLNGSSTYAGLRMAA